MTEKEPIIEELNETVKRSMTDFAQASFVDRYPDVRDGLKPIARRIIYSMYALGLSINGGTKKCAMIVGDVIGKYHPHGDASTYGVLTSMGQSFTYNHTIISGQGNFGNMLGDPAAAYRYTECKFDKYSEIFTSDLNDEVVEYIPNYSRELMEPSVLPAMVPNILINGCYTIGAAAFNSVIPPHNLKDVCNLVIDYIRNPKMLNEDMGKKLMPDFPSGGIIINPDEVREYYTHGTPTCIKMIGKYTIDTETREIHITELPYLVDGNHFKDHIIETFNSNGKKLKDIGIDMITTSCQNENQPTMDVTISYLKGVDPYKLIEFLKSKTKLSGTSQLVFTCVINNKLMVNCTIKDMISEWLNFRRSVVRKILIRKIQGIYREVHILDALIRIYDNMKQLIKFAESAENKMVINQFLMDKYRFSKLQADAISSMKIYELSKESKQSLIDKQQKLYMEMNQYRSKLNDKSIDEIIISQQQYAIKAFGKPRRTEILHNSQIDIMQEIPGVDIVLSLNSGDSISIILKKYLVKGFSGKSLISIKEPGCRRKLYSYNTKNDELFAVTNLGYIYKVDFVKSLVENMTVENSRWINTQFRISQRIGEYIVDFLPIPKLCIENNTGSILVTWKNNAIKRSDVSIIPVRLPKNGTKFVTVDDNYILSNVYFTNASSKDYLLYMNSIGQYHMYPLKQLSCVGKNGIGVIGTPASESIIKMITCNTSDMMYQIAVDGTYICKNISKVPLRKRILNPGVLSNKMNGSSPLKYVATFGIQRSYTLITDKNGWFSVVDLNETDKQYMTQCVDASLDL